MINPITLNGIPIKNKNENIIPNIERMSPIIPPFEEVLSDIGCSCSVFPVTLPIIAPIANAGSAPNKIMTKANIPPHPDGFPNEINNANSSNNVTEIIPPFNHEGQLLQAILISWIISLNIFWEFNLII